MNSEYSFTRLVSKTFKSRAYVSSSSFSTRKPENIVLATYSITAHPKMSLFLVATMTPIQSLRSPQEITFRCVYGRKDPKNVRLLGEDLSWEYAETPESLFDTPETRRTLFKLMNLDRRKIPHEIKSVTRLYISTKGPNLEENEILTRLNSAIPKDLVNIVQEFHNVQKQRYFDETLKYLYKSPLLKPEFRGNVFELFKHMIKMHGIYDAKFSSPLTAKQMADTMKVLELKSGSCPLTFICSFFYVNDREITRTDGVTNDCAKKLNYDLLEDNLTDQGLPREVTVNHFVLTELALQELSDIETLYQYLTDDQLKDFMYIASNELIIF
jgi:hypothetical protein